MDVYSLLLFTQCISWYSNWYLLVACSLTPEVHILWEGIFSGIGGIAELAE